MSGFLFRSATACCYDLLVQQTILPGRGLRQQPVGLLPLLKYSRFSATTRPFTTRATITWTCLITAPYAIVLLGSRLCALHAKSSVRRHPPTQGGLSTPLTNHMPSDDHHDARLNRGYGVKVADSPAFPATNDDSSAPKTLTVSAKSWTSQMRPKRWSERDGDAPSRRYTADRR